ncbi:MAG: hypothetical protein HKO63_09395 [Acidimicrobiia bacterium]|nr:hypothetical protein [Acidimicrobiia bacterium]MBT8193326.1 hypothetical protein [Acidimicrobiia bacterium]NNF87772.1 hypothetical protein [Acidimicrobiia bacterium]NNJ47301.1 hypothetical protein [Acidimicrobiia bacterium]NNL98404.1 hypothetical protein [Acidimicrobiia bacterium]
MHDSFLLVFYGNTGSSWLIQTLGNIPGVFVPGFEPLDEWAWNVEDTERLAWLRTVLSPPVDRAGSAYETWLAALHAHPHFRDPRDPAFVHVGFKMRSHSIRDRMAVLTSLRERGSRLVVLERRNRIKHALSLYRYHEEEKSQFDKSGVRPPSDLDLEVFHRWVTASVDLQRQSDVFWAKAQQVMESDALRRIQYEDFIDEAGKAVTMKHLTGFLGIDAPSYTPSGLEKATSDSLRESIVNFDAVVDRYAGSEFERFLSN